MAATHGPVDNNSALIGVAADSITQLVVGHGPPTTSSTDGDEHDDPLVEMACLNPTLAANFVKSAMLVGSISSGLVGAISGVLLAMHWSSWAQCDRPLRWWLLANCFLQLAQVPLRLSFWASVRGAEAQGSSIPGHLAQLSRTAAWRASKIMSLLTYFLVILGIVWTMNAGNCKTCPRLIGTVVAVLATTAVRVLCAFAGFRLYFPQPNPEGEAPRMVAATAEQIESLDKVTYESDDSDESCSCAVCLSDFSNGETLRKLPCGHKFHMDCCDQWLGRSKKCPLCMQAIDELGPEPETWNCKKRCKPHAH